MSTELKHHIIFNILLFGLAKKVIGLHRFILVGLIILILTPERNVTKRLIVLDTRQRDHQGNIVYVFCVIQLVDYVVVRLEAEY